MKLRGVCRVVLFAVVFATILLVADSPLVMAKPDPTFLESLVITVDCSNASVGITLTVGSDNYTLVHFSSGVNLNATELLNAVGVGVWSNTFLSVLTYSFEGISETAAKANADTVTPSISAAFGVLFTWNSTETIDSEVDVIYTGAGQSNMTSFAEWIVSECVGADVDGFSDALPSLASQTIVAYLMLGADKESGGFDWTTEIILVSSSSIPTGTDPHTIDVLSLLGVSSLTPSSYSLEGGVYGSIVMLTISSTTSINFVSCQPPETTDPTERGWMYTPIPTYLVAFFYFGSDPSPVAPLTFTFGGTVVPEFTPLTLIITLMLTAACIIAFRKRMLRKNRSPSPSIFKEATV